MVKIVFNTVGCRLPSKTDKTKSLQLWWTWSLLYFTCPLVFLSMKNTSGSGCSLVFFLSSPHFILLRGAFQAWITAGDEMLTSTSRVWIRCSEQAWYKCALRSSILCQQSEDSSVLANSLSQLGGCWSRTPAQSASHISMFQNNLYDICLPCFMICLCFCTFSACKSGYGTFTCNLIP